MAASNLFPPMDDIPEPDFSDKSVENDEEGGAEEMVEKHNNEKDLPTKEKSGAEDEIKDHDDDEDLDEEEDLDDDEDDLEDEEDIDDDEEEDDPIEECCQEHFRRLEKGDEDGEKNDDKLKECCAEVYKGFRSFGLKWFKFKQFRRETNGHSEDSADDEALNDPDPDSSLDDPLNSSREESPEKSFGQNPDPDDDDPDPSSFLETSLTEDVNTQKISDDDDDLEIIEEKPAPPKKKFVETKRFSCPGCKKEFRGCHLANHVKKCISISMDLNEEDRRAAMVSSTGTVQKSPASAGKKKYNKRKDISSDDEFTPGKSASNKKKKRKKVNEEDLIECPDCDKKFEKNSELNKHIRVVHDGIKEFTCKVCDVAFAHSSSLKNHFESYAHVKKLKEKNSPNVLQTQLTKADYVAKDDFKGRSALKCAECDMEFSNYLGYRQHMEQAHKGTQRNFFTCTQCGWRFEKEFHMLDHMSSVHGIGDQQPTIANDFPQHFMFSEETTTTENRSNINPTTPLTLTGPKPFKCNKCMAEFAQIWELREHFDIMHASLYGKTAQELGGVGQDKPMMMYQCADCNYWSLVIDELVAHHALVHPELEA